MTSSCWWRWARISCARLARQAVGLAGISLPSLAIRGNRSACPATGIGHRGHLWSGTFDGCACACLAGQRSCSSRIKRWCACRRGKYGAQWQLWLAGSHLGGRVGERATHMSATPRTPASPVRPDAPTGHRYWTSPVRHLGTRIYPILAQCLHADRQLRGCLQRRKERPHTPARSTAQSPSASHPLAFEGERTGGGVSEGVDCRTGGILGNGKRCSIGAGCAELGQTRVFYRLWCNTSLPGKRYGSITCIYLHILANTGGSL